MKKQANHLSRQKTVEELAELLNCSSEGYGKTEISKVASLNEAQKGDLVQVLLSQGELECRVEKLAPRHDPLS